MNRSIYKLLLFCMVSMLSVFVHAASLQVTYHINDATETVTSGVSTEGNLATLLGDEDKALKVTQLSVKGYLNDADIRLLQKMAGYSEGTDSNVPGSLISLNLSEATFTETGKIVPESIFQNCKNLQHVDLSNMTEIGKWAFNNCALTEISIPASVTIIREEAFKGCSALKTLKFEAGTTEKELVLKEEAFFGCGNMDLADGGALPSRIISIANRTFMECGITKLTLPANEKLTGVSRNLEFNGVQTDNMGALGYGVFFGCRKLTDLTIPANVTVINEVAFQGCNLKNVTFADATKITKIQMCAFANNQNLTGVFAGKNFNNLKTIGEGAFLNCFKLTDADFNTLTKNVTRIERETFRNCHDGLQTIDIHSGITFIGDGAFADNYAVKEVIVHSGTQIDARSYDGTHGIFLNMDPNKVQVVFKDEAEKHYSVYRDNIVVDGVNKGNAFMYLLTKTLDENATDYEVVAQRHADVLLKRTFKPGWNTLVLPFGARDNGKTVKCARIYQKALNAFDGEGFMIAAYRGLAKNDAQPDNSTFYFLQYADYDNDQLDEFEPLLVRMTQKDIDNASGVYTFKDIELNYDADLFTSYTAEGAKGRMGITGDGRYFDGNYDHDKNDKFKNCSYDDFYFTGTLYKQDTDKNPAFIAPGDYIIQNNTFVKCLSGKKYGLKGFRGYFKQKPSGGTSSAKGNIGICLVDRNGVVSSIHQVDGASLTSASVAPVAVYNLSGQQVGNSLSTLAKGVYIVKGKKFVKK